METIVAYVTVTLWTATEITEDMMAIVNEKYVPMVLAVGASGIQLVRTGELSMFVIPIAVNWPDSECRISDCLYLVH